jgi:hypothetical protein
MTYKAFQDWYHSAYIKHLILIEYQGNLISPPFATEKCKDYSRVLVWNKDYHSYIDLDLPPVTSKTNAVVESEGSLWFIPYGIYDDFNTVVEIQNSNVFYHNINRAGKGQFYGAASNGSSVFSFPLGYEETSYGIYIKDRKVYPIDFDRNSHVKLHMGCVYANGKYWSMPRGDTEGYIDLVSFDGNTLEKYPINGINTSVTRKYTDLIAVDNTLYSLPFGETPGLNEVVEFDTENKTVILHKINGPDFAKKYNVAVLVENKIIAVPYGDEFCSDSNLGIVFDTVSKESKQFDIKINYGGKYRYRCGVAYKGSAFFFPTGTPSCPIIKVSQEGKVEELLNLSNTMVGRPIVYKDKIFAMTYNIISHQQQILSFDENLTITIEFKL